MLLLKEADVSMAAVFSQACSFLANNGGFLTFCKIHEPRCRIKMLADWRTKSTSFLSEMMSLFLVIHLAQWIYVWTCYCLISYREGLGTSY